MKSAERKLKVFLCHASQDKPVVRELYQRLAAEGWIDPWLDEEKLLPGMDWEYEIEKALDASDAVCVCISNTSVSKEGYVQRELRFVIDIALEKPEGAIYILPVRLDDCQPPRKLRTYHWADYFPQERRDWAYQRLLKSLALRAEALGISIMVLASQATIPPDEADASPNRWTVHDMEFCHIPAGKFVMGSADSDNGAYDDEKPEHEINIPYDYWVARFPVTNAQYAQYARAVGVNHPSTDWKEKKDHPVVRVSWHDARTYCQWFNDTFKDELPPNYMLRLPSEAEWEKAARGSGDNIYPWGDQFDKTKCNSEEGGEGETTPVGSYSPQGDSPYGCADMSGNVWEWTSSLLKDYPYNPNDSREIESVDGRRVLRGGSFVYIARMARCACRGDNPELYLCDNSGFRLILSPIPS